MSQQANENPTDAASNNSGASGNQSTGPQTMSLDDATIERIAAASSRQAAQNVRDNGSHQQPVAQDNGSSNGNQSDVMTAIQALPEQITRSIQEALQPPQQTGAGSNDSGNGAGSNNSGQQQDTATEPAKKKSFAEWWFQS